MQSDSPKKSPIKNPYLVQFKNETIAKQKLLRERLGIPEKTYRTNDDVIKSDKNAIPSIDGDDDDDLDPLNDIIEQYTHDRRYKSLYTSGAQSEADAEAEASLQFFRKNLSKPSTSSTTAKIEVPRGSLFELGNRKVPYDTKTRFIPETNASSLRSTKKVSETAQVKVDRPRPILDHFDLDLEYEQNRSSPETFQSSRSVPYKQTSLNELMQDKLPRSARQETKDHSKNYVGRNLSSSAKVSSVNINNESEGLAGSRLPNEQSSVTEPKIINKSNGHVRRQADKIPETRVDQSTDGQYQNDRVSPASTFSRKPLYNSLLRAHDSIRLKINRPKVRPKSKEPVEDTEVDDSIQLAEINTIPTANERGVDIRRASSKRKSKKKEAKDDKSSEVKVPIRNFSEVRIVRIIRTESERSLGVTVKAEDGNIVVARIMAGSLADKQGALQVGDIILAINNREVYTPEQLQEELRRSLNEDTVVMKVVPSHREELPTLCIYLRALFSYDANSDSLLPCKEVGVSFNQGDILEVVNQEDPNWWQARRVDSENLQTGLIPSQELEERRRAFVLPDYDLATKTSICGTKVSRKSKKKEIYNVGQNNDFDKAELQLYQEVCRTPAFERRTLVFIGANGVGKQAFKIRLIELDPERFGTPLPHTSRLPRDGEEDGIHYHFVTRERMEEDIIAGKYLEFGEYDGALYGTKLDSVREIIGSGKVCVLDCSPTCLKILKTADYLPFVAFIAAPTLDQLRCVNEYARNYTFDRALSRQSRRARTLQDFAYDFFEDEDLQLTVEESARLFRLYENYFDIVLVNNNFERTFEQLKDAIDALSMAPQWIPISWIYGE